MREAASKQENVLFYPAYGYLKNDAWQIPLQAWVQEDRALLEALADLPGKLGITERRELQNFHQRIRAFMADSKSRQRVMFRFEQDPEQQEYALQDNNGESQKSGLNGLVEGVLSLPVAKAEDLLRQQNSQSGWLTFQASSAGHSGTGRIQLIPPTGLSIVSDIDDTVKVTEIPAGKEVVVRNTFLRDFVAAPEMAAMYQQFDHATFHYVSGGPFQLYAPLSEFLLQAGFPEGTFHMKVIPKHLLSLHTWEGLARLVVNPAATFDHKIKEISELLRRFPQREFILIGDSGERDPEIYAQLRREFKAQIKEIRIRDVVNDQENNKARLAEMTIIPVIH